MDPQEVKAFQDVARFCEADVVQHCMPTQQEGMMLPLLGPPAKSLRTLEQHHSDKDTPLKMMGDPTVEDIVSFVDQKVNI